MDLAYILNEKSLFNEMKSERLLDEEQERRIDDCIQEKFESIKAKERNPSPKMRTNLYEPERKGLTNRENQILFWRKVIKDIEIEANIERKERHIQNIDYSKTLPPYLRKRVNHIIPYEYDEYDRMVFLDDSSKKTSIKFESEQSEVEEEEISNELRELIRRRLEERKKNEYFNESTCSEIERMENEYQHIEAKFDTPMEREEVKKKVVNWCSDYICKKRRARVIWDSRIYDMEQTLWEKSLDEQAEALMDASAERFADWLNNLTENHDNDITPLQLKILFSIEGDRKLSASILTDPKEVKAIAKTIADKWNMSNMAIELKYEQHIADRLSRQKTKGRAVSFGRTIPEKYRPWLPSDRDRAIITAFPNEILSGERLFKGIGHLRSTKKLVKFMRRHPRISKPGYLVESGFFRKKSHLSGMNDMPLYEKLGLKY